MLLEGSFLSIDDKQHLAQAARDESNKIALIEHLRQAIGEKDRFLASVSHELRTPLNGIIGLSDTLLQVSPDDDLELAVACITSSSFQLEARELSKLINNVFTDSFLRNHFSREVSHNASAMIFESHNLRS